MHSEPNLAKRIGRLIRIERERRAWSQGKLAERIGVHPSVVSRLELGRHAPTTTVIDRAFAEFGQRLVVDVEPMDITLDREILAVREMDAADRESVAIPFRFPLDKARAVGLDFRLCGAFGAFLQGVPVGVESLDVAISEDSAARFQEWLSLVPSVLRWNDRLREFTGYSRDPRDPGPLRWWSPGCLIGGLVLPELPPPIMVREGARDYPVLPLPAIIATDARVARVVARADRPGG